MVEPTNIPKTDNQLFSQYVLDYVAGKSGTDYSVFKPIVGPSSVPQKTDPENMGFWGRTIDILSRPMRIVSNPVDKALDAVVEFDEAKKLEQAGMDVEADKKRLAAVGTVLAAPFTGFFSDKAENKPYWADIIEKEYDVRHRNAPGYVNVENNVNPVAKGVAGFVGDFLLDPLWLIPPLKAVKATGMTAKGASAGLRTVEETAKSVNAAKTATQALVDKGRFGPATLTEPASKVVLRKTTPTADNLPVAQLDQVAQEAVTKASKKGTDVDSELLKSLREKIDAKQIDADNKLFRTNDFRKELLSLFSGLKRGAKSDLTAAAKVPAEVSTTSRSLLGIEQWADEVAVAIDNGTLANPKLAQPVKVGNQSVTNMRELLSAYKFAKSRGEESARRLFQYIKQGYAGYKSAVDAGREANLFGRVQKTPVVESVNLSYADLLANRIRTLSDESYARFESLLGKNILGGLQRTSPERLAPLVDDITTILKQSGGIQNLGRFNASDPRSKILNLFDIHHDEVKQMWAKGNVSRRVDEIPVRTKQPVEQKFANAADDIRVEDELSAQLAATGIKDATSGFEKTVTEAKETFGRIFRKFVDSQYNPEKLREIYKASRSKRKNARQTKEEYALGTALIDNTQNSYKMWTLFKMLNQDFTSKFDNLKLFLRGADAKKRIYAAPLAKSKRDLTLSSMTTAEKIIDDLGLPHVLDMDGVAFNLRFTEVYQALAASARGIDGGSDALLLSFFNGGTPAAITKVLDAVAVALKGESPEIVRDVLRSTERRNPLKARTTDDAMGIADDVAELDPIPNWLAGTERGNFGHIPGKTKPTAALPEGVVYVQGDKGWYKAWDPEAVANKLTDMIMGAKEGLIAKAAVNAENYARRFTAEATAIADAGATTLLDMMRTPGLFEDAVKTIRNYDNMVDDYANAIDATPAARTIADGLLDAAMGSGLKSSAKAIDDVAKAASEGRGLLSDEHYRLYRTSIENAEAGIRAGEDLVDEYLRTGRLPNDVPPAAADDLVEEIVERDISTKYLKESQDGRLAIGSGILSWLDPLHKAFSRKFGMGTKENLWAYNMFDSTTKIVAEWSGRKLKAVEAITRNPAYTQDVLKKAMENAQRGVRNEANPVVRQAQQDIEGVIGDIIGGAVKAEDSILGNVFLRTGAGLEYIENIFRNYFGRNVDNIVTTRGDAFFDLGEAAALMSSGTFKRTLQEAAFSQWRTWKIEDPTMFMGNLVIAASRVAADVSFVDNFVMKALKDGLASTKAQKGYVKLVATGKSHYGDLLGMREVYFRPELAEIIHSMDEVARSSQKFEGLFGKIAHEYLDVVTDQWKYAITLPRPGHHLRNLWGDESFTYTAQGAEYYMDSATKALQVLSTRNNYTDVDLVRGLRALGQETPPRMGDIIIRKNNNVKWAKNLSADEIYRLAMENGILPSVMVNEGLFTDTIKASRFSRAAEMFTRIASFGLASRGGKLENLAMGISQYRDHYARLHHFIQYIQQAQSGKVMTRTAFKDVKPQSFEEMIEFAAERVKKYHPDTSQLSPFEMKYMRRLIPFYSWTRGAVQALAEATAANPARVTAFSKVSYNLAIAAGINPHSMYYPYPDDQLFPSFFVEEVQGPQFKADGRYYGFSPGLAPWDVPNMLTGSPTEISMGSLNPVFRLPLELLTGSNLGTGSKIRDYSDQIDSSIPGVNYFSNISTYSVTGSIASLLSGQGLDKQLQYELGNKGPTDQLISLFNWTTGAGLRDYSRPSYIRFAQQELRDQNNPDKRGF